MQAHLGPEFRGMEVSSGTLRSGDLIESMRAFLDEHLAPDLDATARYGKLVRAFETDVTALAVQFGTGADSMNCEAFEAQLWHFMDEFVNDLEEVMNDIAPEGTFYGSHEGDGAAFGFWPIEEVD